MFDTLVYAGFSCTTTTAYGLEVRDGHSARPHHRPLPRSSRGGEAPGRPARRALGGVTRRLRARVRQREPDPRLRPAGAVREPSHLLPRDRKSTRLNSSHTVISYAVFCLKK